ncbi:MAG: DUF1648 domain-containing protein [Clostridia bacterium]|nr:DUF1648 domain-containing protein [Clostridia bacterium]
MKKINFKILIITCIICLLPIVFGIIFYNDLPETVAVHFDINNNPDGFMPKEFLVFGMPAIMMLIQMFACVVSDLKDENPEANKRTMFMYKLIIPVMDVIVYVVTIMYAMGNMLDIRKIVMIILGIMFIVMGNYLPKTVGYNSINFPKIKNEKIYAKVKRVFGYIFIINGLLAIASTLFDVIVSVFVIILLVVEAIVLGIYSLVKNKKEN